MRSLWPASVTNFQADITSVVQSGLMRESAPPRPLCFGEGTFLLTRQGPLAIEQARAGDIIRTSKRMGSGHESQHWATLQAIYIRPSEGRAAIPLSQFAQVTPDHLILTGSRWLPACQAVSNTPEPTPTEHLYGLVLDRPTGEEAEMGIVSPDGWVMATWGGGHTGSTRSIWPEPTTRQ